MKAVVIGACILGCYGCIAAEAIMFGRKAAAILLMALLLAGVAKGLLE